MKKKTTKVILKIDNIHPQMNKNVFLVNDFMTRNRISMWVAGKRIKNPDVNVIIINKSDVYYESIA